MLVTVPQTEKEGKFGIQNCLYPASLQIVATLFIYFIFLIFLRLFNLIYLIEFVFISFMFLDDNQLKRIIVGK